MIRSRIFLRNVPNETVKRYLSLSLLDSARVLLGLDANSDVTSRQLRKAYLQAAKRCHPDIQKNKDGDDFRKINEAYEYLQSGVVPDPDLGITIQEDAAFRASCQEWLGLPAEVVEESKLCPIFRQWLDGKTDAASRWKFFLAMHGGLAPMLRPPVALIEDQREYKGLNRRRRK
jgi:hypothetical protein